MEIIRKTGRAAALGGLLLATACGGTGNEDDMVSGLGALTPDGALEPPTIEVVGSTQTTLTLRVCGGADGAAAGVSIHWIEAGPGVDPLDAQSWEGHCGLSASGNASGSLWNLGPGACEEIEIGNLVAGGGVSWADGCNEGLQCGTEYLFAAFAHNVPQGPKKSGWSAPVAGSTSSCDGGDGGCTYSQGYWKNHPDAWPLSSVTLGSESYTVAEGVACLQTPPAKGNALIQLAHQLIAAKLNGALGADPTDLGDAVAQADAIFSARPGWRCAEGAAVVKDAAITSLASFLDAWNTNQDGIGPGHCEDDEATVDEP